MNDIANDVQIVGSIPAVPSILDVVCRTTGMGFAAVARVTEEKWVACSVLDHIKFGLKAGDELKLETTICHEIRQMKHAVIIDHVDKDDLYRDHHTPRMYGFQSYISVPLFLSDGSFFGTLCAIDPRPADLKRPEIEGMFKLFGELIVFHLETIQKLAQAERHLTAEREASVLREQFIGVLGHDLRTPLGAISMGVTLLGEDSLNEEQTQIVIRMERSVSRMSDLINDAMDFTRGRLGGGITLEAKVEQPVEPVLRQVIDDARSNWPDREIQVQMELGTAMAFDRKRMAQLFTNLLSNAMVHGLPGTPVKVSACTGSECFALSVSNAATPIPPQTLSRIFEPFSRGGSNNYRDGLGLGLYIASQIAKSHGGRLSVISTNEETRFTFEMPLVKTSLFLPNG